MAGKIALRAEKGKHELLEIGPLVLAEPVRDMKRVVGLVFSPHAHRASIVMNHGAIDAEALERLHADLGENLPCSMLVDAVEDPADGVVVEHLRAHILSEKERSVP